MTDDGQNRPTPRRARSAPPLPPPTRRIVHADGAGPVPPPDAPDGQPADLPPTPPPDGPAGPAGDAGSDVRAAPEGDRVRRQARPAGDVARRRPDYRGAELDPERGPGLGCFWFQVIVLAFFVVIIPIGVNLAWPFELLAILLFIVIGLLLLTGQTVIFLLRLVAADRRAQGRRRPLAAATRTVGELEDAQAGETAGRTAAQAGETAGRTAADAAAQAGELPGEPAAEAGELPGDPADAEAGETAGHPAADAAAAGEAVPDAPPPGPGIPPPEEPPSGVPQ